MQLQSSLYAEYAHVALLIIIRSGEGNKDRECNFGSWRQRTVPVLAYNWGGKTKRAGPLSCLQVQESR